jgi:hypothetical protein
MSASSNQIAAEMGAGHCLKAESMLREVLVEHPNSAKAQSMLSQVQLAETKPGVCNNGGAVATRTVVTQPAPVYVAPHHHSNNGFGVFLAIILIAAVIGGIIWAIVAATRRREVVVVNNHGGYDGVVPSGSCPMGYGTGGYVRSSSPTAVAPVVVQQSVPMGVGMGPGYYGGGMGNSLLTDMLAIDMMENMVDRNRGFGGGMVNETIVNDTGPSYSAPGSDAFDFNDSGNSNSDWDSGGSDDFSSDSDW